MSEQALRAAHVERDKAIKHFLAVHHAVEASERIDAGLLYDEPIEQLIIAHLAFVAARRRFEAPVTGISPTFPKPKCVAGTAPTGRAQ
jgi:hypothetical protein